MARPEKPDRLARTRLQPKECEYLAVLAKKHNCNKIDAWHWIVGPNCWVATGETLSDRPRDFVLLAKRTQQGKLSLEIYEYCSGRPTPNQAK